MEMYLLINCITPFGVHGIRPVKSPMATRPSFIMFSLQKYTRHFRHLSKNLKP